MWHSYHKHSERQTMKDIIGSNEIVIGRWKTNVSQEEAVAIRCAVARHLSKLVPPNLMAKPALEQFMFDATNKHDESLVMSGYVGKSVWLQLGEVRVEMNQSRAFRLWKALEGMRAKATSGKASLQPEADVDDFLDDEWKLSAGIE
jgi:hypothetical protein